MTDSATRFTGEIPKFYDSGLGPTFFEPYAEVLADVVAAARPQSVLELAAGTGISTRAIANRLPSADLTVTDLNDDMLAIARQKVPRATFSVADAQELQFEAASFDLVAFQFGAMFLPDLTRAFLEARRVLRSGGTYCFSVWSSHTANPAARLVDQLLTELFPDDAPPFWRVPYSLGDIDALVDRLQVAGFGRIEVAVEPIEAPVPSWPNLAIAMLRGNPSGGQIEARGGNVDDVASKLTALFAGEFGQAPTTTRMQAVFYTAHPR